MAYISGKLRAQRELTRATTDQTKRCFVYLHAACDKAVEQSNDSKRQVSDELLPHLNEIAAELKRLSLDSTLPVSERLAAAELLSKTVRLVVDKEAGARLAVEKKTQAAARRAKLKSIDKRHKVAEQKRIQKMLDRHIKENGGIDGTF